MSGLACKEHLSAWRSEKFKSSGRDRTSKLEASLEWKHDAVFECARIEVSLQTTNEVCHWKLKKKISCQSIVPFKIHLATIYTAVTWKDNAILIDPSYSRTKARYTRLWCSDVTAVLGTEVVWGTDSVGLGAGNMTRRNLYFALFWASPFRTSIWVSGWTPKIKLFRFSDLR